MKDMYSRFTEEDLWVVKENEWDLTLQNIREAQFAIGNGYLGTRAVMEEIPKSAAPGTYIAGIYDKLSAKVSEMVNFPNPFNFKFAIGGEKIGAVTMDILSHRRAINMRKGVLVRRTVFKGSQGVRFNLESMRFVSMHDKNIGVMRINLTSLDSKCVLDVQTGIDTSVHNIGTLTEGKKKHFRLRELGQHKNAGYIVAETFEKKHAVVYWGGFYYKVGKKKKTYGKDNIFKIELEKGETAAFTKVFYVKDFSANKSQTKIKDITFKKFYKSFHADFNTLLDAHVNEWKKIWDRADILIKGTANLQKIMRFNIYHMLICAASDNGFSSIGARTLSGEGYRGHIFWDAEVFLFPYYLYTFPEVAKNMLLYRYNRLDAARQIARERGYKGVMFPWESADSGFDETPSWAKDINGQIVEIHTNEMEHHITSDIAYAVSQYYNATDDADFMKNHGYEMMFETARFCASRFEFNKKKKVYEIKNIIGPDEFHVGVNNNVFTNTIMKWNMLKAAEMFDDLKKNKPKLLSALKKKIDLKDAEVVNWEKIADKVKKPNVNKDGVIEQHDGYFKLKNVVFEDMDENGVPILPEELGTIDMGKTQFIKQCDILMLLYMMPEMFKDDALKPNYKYYIKRTAHKSSLSASTSALMGGRAKDLYRAYHLFNVSLRADISNLYGNTNEGAHAASLGGTYQALIFGFGGVICEKDLLCIEPNMPRTWENLVFCFCWKGRLINFEIGNWKVQFRIKSRNKEKMKMKVFGALCEVVPNKTYTYERTTDKLRTAFYY